GCSPWYQMNLRWSREFTRSLNYLILCKSGVSLTGWSFFWKIRFCDQNFLIYFSILSFGRGGKNCLFSGRLNFSFETCKYYLEIIFKADVNFIHLQKCREAFLCICILAERPDLQLRSFTKALPLLEDVFEPTGVQFFDHLFNDDTKPLFFKEHLTDCSFEDRKST